MKRVIGVVLVMAAAFSAVVFLGGCSRPVKEKPAVNEQAKRLLMEGTVFLKQGEVVQAVQNFAAAIKVAPDYFEAYLLLSQTFIHLKQFEQARSVLSMAAERFPDNPVTYYFLSMVYEGSGNLMPAIVSARKSIDLFRLKKDDEGEKRATILLGVLVQRARQQAEAQLADEQGQQASAQAATAAVAAETE